MSLRPKCLLEFHQTEVRAKQSSLCLTLGSPFKPIYRLSPNERQEVERQMAELLKKGLIEPSLSPCRAPIQFAAKKDGSSRTMIDSRALNKQTVKYRCPLPRIDDHLFT